MQILTAVPWRARDLFFALVAMLIGIGALNVSILLLDRVGGGALKENRDALTFALILQEAIILAAAWLFSVARYRAAWAQLGLRSFNAPMGCAWAFGLLIASYALRFCYLAGAFAFGVRLNAQSVINVLSTTGVGLWLTFIAAGVAAPIAEEIFFRGFIYGGLRARVGIIPALLISATIFTALHFTLELFIPIFILGIFLAWLYEKSGSLVPGMLLHSANNSIAILALVVIQATGTPVNLNGW